METRRVSELAAIVAHEVRNPLAGLRGSPQVLATRLPPDMREREIVGALVDRIDVLAIVKRLADLQELEVALEDREGGGARARLTLPRPP